MLPTERVVYSPIVDRPRLLLPGGARLAVWVIVNVEEWNPLEQMPRTVLTPPAGGSPMPDVPNWAWHEYGNRVGFWRLLEVFYRLRVPGVIAINGGAVQAYQPVIRRASWITLPACRYFCRRFFARLGPLCCRTQRVRNSRFELHSGPIARAALERRWEFIGHGFGQRSMQEVPTSGRISRRRRRRSSHSQDGGRAAGWDRG